MGSGAAAGTVLGVLMALGIAGGGGDTQGLGAVFLAIALALASGVAGGVIAGAASHEPGQQRFVSAAVPLGGVWLLSAGLAIDAW